MVDDDDDDEDDDNSDDTLLSKNKGFAGIVLFFCVVLGCAMEDFCGSCDGIVPIFLVVQYYNSSCSWDTEFSLIPTTDVPDVDGSGCDPPAPQSCDKFNFLNNSSVDAYCSCAISL